MDGAQIPANFISQVQATLRKGAFQGPGYHPEPCQEGLEKHTAYLRQEVPLEGKLSWVPFSSRGIAENQGMWDQEGPPGSTSSPRSGLSGGPTGRGRMERKA